jgi:hypothetical protein
MVQRSFVLGFFMLAFFSTVFFKANAQHSIWLLDGKKMEVSNFKLNTSDSTINYKTIDGKSRVLPCEQVFAVYDSLGTEQLIYVPNLTDRLFSVEQMKNYLQGERDAKLSYNPKGVFWGGVGIGAVTPVLLPVIKVHYALSPLTSASYSGFMGMKKINESKLNIPEKYKSDQYYLQGYLDAANKKRMKKSLFGGGVGLVVGFALLVLTR